MDQIAKFVGSEGPNWSNRQIRAEQWGAKGVRWAEMDQIAKFVLNNGGAKWVPKNPLKTKKGTLLFLGYSWASW